MKTHVGNRTIPDLACRGQHLPSNDHTTSAAAGNPFNWPRSKGLLFFFLKNQINTFPINNLHCDIVSYRDVVLFLFTVSGT